MKKIVSFFLTVLISSLTIAQETMTFQAEIANKNGNTLSIKSGRETVQKIEADEKGNFKATFPIKEGLYQLFDGVEYANLFLKNGYNLKMTMDATKFDESISFSGNGSAENNFLANRTLEESKIDFQGMLELDAEGFKKATEELKATQIASLEASKIDANLIDMLKKGTEANIGQLQQYYTMSLTKKKMNNVAAPNFDFENHKGGKTTLESLKGKYVYVDLWATWCGPCRAEIPSLKKMEETFHGKNIEFVSISIDAEKDYEKWKTFVTEKALTGTQLYAAKANQTEFVKAFEVNSIPRFILIDPKGIVVDADAKRPSDPRLQEQLNKLLN
ncbi:TlpA family protein disulfide reductase [Flavobacterium sp. IMCC34852]|uniref:TlpA family protein disulfide reductase n=1 Tax=Flavobacterium rivulicola TaxID=2732161 RepID=A0A7Y3VXQ2_9FLAO|nr:TlpA disulfide reductase family protein [Flavobacterium sp. IMCC34852]NNT70818.1 TlpA family protein disulfide reductase [Flavobacterium sp. IMCC34852]